jgi:hypothetical protein
MAIACVGVTAVWNGTAFGEVSKIDVQRGGELPMGRSTRWTLDAGTIEISSFSTTRLTADQYGLKSTLQVTGGGLTFTTKAVCQSLRATGAVNDVTRYVGVFKIVME